MLHEVMTEIIDRIGALERMEQEFKIDGNAAAIQNVSHRKSELQRLLKYVNTLSQYSGGNGFEIFFERDGGEL